MHDPAETARLQRNAVVAAGPAANSRQAHRNPDPVEDPILIREARRAREAADKASAAAWRAIKDAEAARNAADDVEYAAARAARSSHLAERRQAPCNPDPVEDPIWIKEARRAREAADKASAAARLAIKYAKAARNAADDAEYAAARDARSSHLA